MQDFREMMKIESQYDMGFSVSRKYKGLSINGFTLSAQASEFHYCYPRITTDLGNYSSIEIALFDKDGSWVNPHQDERFNDFPRREELLERWEDSDICVAGYVSVDLVQSLCDYLETL